MFKAKKLTRNFAQGSLFRPLGHSRQFFVGALTTSGILGIVAFGLMAKSSIEVHVMPQKTTDTSAELKASQAHGSNQVAVEVSSAVAPAESQQSATSHPVPAQIELAITSNSDISRSQLKSTPAAASSPAASATTRKNDAPVTTDLSTLAGRTVTGVNIPLY